MKKIVFATVVFTIFSFTATCQGVVQWAKNIGSTDNEHPTKICADSSGNAYMAGAYFLTLPICNDTLVAVTQTQSSNGTQNLFISKFDSLGNCIWAKAGVSVVPLLNGGAIGAEITDMEYFDGYLYCVGVFTDTMIFDNHVLFNPTCISYCTSSFIIAFDAATGAVSWSKCFEGSITYSSVSAIVPYSGGLFVAGTYENYLTVDSVTLHPAHTWGYSAYVLKFNKLGVCTWGKNIGLSTNSGIGAMVYDNDKNLYLVGNYADTIVFAGDTIWDIMPGYERGTFFAKYDTSGNYIWARGGRPFMRAFFRSGALCYASNNYLYFVGAYEDSTRIGTTTLTSPAGFYRDVILKIDRAGQFVWAKQAVAQRPFTQGFPSTIAANNQGFLLFSGFSYQEVLGNDTVQSNGSLDDLLTQYDFDGNVMYYKHFGGASQEIAKDVYCNGPYTYFTSRTMSDYVIDNWNITNVAAGDILIGRMLDTTATVSVGEYAINRQASFVVYPNPSTGVVLVAGQTEIKEIIVKNCLGGVIASYQPNADFFKLNLSVSGLYFVTIFDGHHSQNRKITIL